MKSHLIIGASYFGDFMPFFSIEITIGFEQASYDFSEPSFGTSTQMICIQLRSGTLGSNLLIQPEWTQNTATGKKFYASVH